MEVIKVLSTLQVEDRLPFNEENNIALYLALLKTANVEHKTENLCYGHMNVRIMKNYTILHIIVLSLKNTSVTLLQLCHAVWKVINIIYYKIMQTKTYKKNALYTA